MTTPPVVTDPSVGPLTPCAGLVNGKQCGANFAAHNTANNPQAHLFVDPATVPPGNLPPATI